MEAKADINSIVTHEVVRNANEKVVFEGSGQQCSDYQYENKGKYKGKSTCVRHKFNI